MDLTGEAGKRAAEGWDAILKAHLGADGATLVWTFICAAGAVLSLVFWRYGGVLGAGEAAEGSRERQAYDDLRASLSDGGSPTRIYGRLLTAFLNEVDGFFGDHDKAHLGVFRHAFSLRGSYPLWTGAALDRCLLLALLYPIVSVLMIWAISGHVGPAERALGFTAGTPKWQGEAIAVALVLTAFSIFWGGTGQSRRRLLFVALLVVVAIAVTTGAVVTTSAMIVGILLFVGNTAFTQIKGAGVAAVSIAVSLAVQFANTAVGSGLASGAVGVAALFAVLVGVPWLSNVSARMGRQGGFVSVFGAGMVALIIFLALLLSHMAMWRIAGPLLLFFGLLTLLNAPFIWFSVGLTRALLRRGVELRGWWPYGLAVADAALALVIVVLLVGATVIGVQAFDLATTLGEGSPVLPLGPLFDGIARHPGDPANWWLYALLLSTLIPSITNLLIGSASLTRGVPGASTLLLRYMPPGAAVLSFDRAWIAAALTAQWAIGGILMLTAFAILAWLVALLVPGVGTWCLDYARAVADLDFPAHVVTLLGY